MIKAIFISLGIALIAVNIAGVLFTVKIILKHWRKIDEE